MKTLIKNVNFNEKLKKIVFSGEMLLVGGEGVEYRPIYSEEVKDPELVYESFPDYRSEAEQLTKLPETILGAPGVIYVNQRQPLLNHISHLPF